MQRKDFTSPSLSGVGFLLAPIRSYSLFEFKMLANISTGLNKKKKSKKNPFSSYF